MYLSTFVCLANSRKRPSGRCIAGKEQATGAWIRPVSARANKEISEEERRYENGARASVLDIVTVPLFSASPAGHQTENHTIDAGYYWTKQGRANWGTVLGLVDPYDPNFWLPVESTIHGLNDKIGILIAGRMNSSLKLIQPVGLQIKVYFEPGFNGAPSRKRVRAMFQYNNVKYSLIVSDPIVEEQYLAKTEGSYPIETAVICVSHTELWDNGYASRLVATVITPDRCN